MNMIKKMSRTAKYLLSIPLFLGISFAVGFVFQREPLENLSTALLAIGMMTAWMFFSNEVEENMNFREQSSIDKFKIIVKNVSYLMLLMITVMGGIVLVSYLLKLNIVLSLKLMRPFVMFAAGLYLGLVMQKHGLGGQIPAPE